MANQAGKQVHAPYNFVPFSTKVYARYQSMEELPAYDEIDSTRKTGEIHVTLKAETPVFVSNGSRELPGFFRTAEGKFAIPGSSVRGMVRQNMQILGFGFMRPGEDIEDYQIYFREMAAAKGCVKRDLKEYYKAVLNIESGKGTIPKAVQAGYLHCDGGKYRIVPTKSPYLRVSRSHPDMKEFAAQYAQLKEVYYQTDGDRVTKLVFSGCPEMKKGVLLFTGRPVGRVPNHVYLFPEEDIEAVPEEISTQDILSYQMDLEGRENTLRKYGVDFWRLPKEGRSKPIFYVHHNGHLYFGMSLYLRIGYQYSVCQGLPRIHRKKAQESVVLDYPSAILGFARGEYAYRSRVSFEDFILEGSGKQGQKVETVLGGPKPSYYPAYVKSGKNYNDSNDDCADQQDADRGFELRGYKQYWLKEAAPAELPNENKKVASVLCPLDTGSVFHGVIRFKNLSEDELGLLLWSLRLEDGCYQSIGMGKPYGYGRMKLTIDGVREINFHELYQSLSCSPKKPDTSKVEAYIAAFERFFAQNAFPQKKKAFSIREQDEIKDFFYIKSTIREAADVSYMKLEEYGNSADKPLTEIQAVRRKEDEKPKASSMEDLLAELQKQFGAHHTTKK